MLGLTPAVLSLFGNRSISLVSGTVTSLLIVMFLNPEIQGYHYTFLTLAAMAGLAEFGFAGATQQFAAHEWAHLELNSNKIASGESDSLDRLASIVKLTFLWAIGGGLLLSFTLLAVGYVMFSAKTDGVLWLGPWLILSIATGVDFCGNLIFTMLEGCDQVAEVNVIRLARLGAYSLVMWSAMALGGGLWAAPLGMAAAASLIMLSIVVRWRRFFLELARRATEQGIKWRDEFLPLQLKFGSSSIVNYISFSLLVPITFALEGSVKAGQLGLTWIMVESVIALSGAWFVVNVPQYSAFVVRGERASLDRLALISTLRALATMVVFGAVALGMIWAISVHFESLYARFLPIYIIGLLLIGGGVRVVIWSAWVYVRSYKQEPFLKLQLLGGPILLTVFALATDLRSLEEALILYTAVSMFVLAPATVAVFVRFYRAQNQNSDHSPLS